MFMHAVWVNRAAVATSTISPIIVFVTWERAVDLTPIGGLDGFPVVTRIGWSVGDAAYHRTVAGRGRRNGIIQVTLAGGGWYKTHPGQEPTSVPVGMAMILHSDLHPDLTYGTLPGGSWEFLYFDVDGEAARICLGALTKAHGHALPLTADDPTIVTARRMIPRQTLQVRGWPVADAARMANGLLTTLAKVANLDEHRLTSRAMQWLADRLDQEINLTSCAEALGVSREHLTRSFTRHAGCPPARWLHERRLTRAAALLREPGAQVATVAQACGFASPAHFAHAFKRHMGLSPRQFRSPESF
jgi:AraC-like DNA-binding protein